MVARKVAKNVYNYLLTLSVIGVNHERIHVATPEEDGYIESFHSIMHNEFETKYEFDSFEEQRDHLIKWFEFYNNERIHSAIDYCTPSEFYNQYMEKINWYCQIFCVKSFFSFLHQAFIEG